MSNGLCYNPRHMGLFLGEVAVMSGLFGSSRIAPPPTPPPAPTMANTDTDAAAREAQLRLQRGRSSTLLTAGGGAGLSDMGTTSKTLLGQ